MAKQLETLLRSYWKRHTSATSEDKDLEKQERGAALVEHIERLLALREECKKAYKNADDNAVYQGGSLSNADELHVFKRDYDRAQDAAQEALLALATIPYDAEAHASTCKTPGYARVMGSLYDCVFGPVMLPQEHSKIGEDCPELLSVARGIIHACPVYRQRLFECTVNGYSHGYSYGLLEALTIHFNIRGGFDRTHMLTKIAAYFFDRTQYTRAASVYRQAFESAKTNKVFRRVRLRDSLMVQSRIDERVVEIAIFLANSLHRAQLMNEALSAAEDAVQAARERFGPCSLHLAWALDILGTLQLRSGNYSSGKENLVAAVKLYESASRFEKLRTMNRYLRRTFPIVIAIAHLAECHRAFGDTDKERQCIAKQLDLLKSIPLRPEHVGHDERVDYAEAILRAAPSESDLERRKSLLQHALQIHRERLGESHADLASPLRMLAFTEREMGELDRAEEHLNEALRVLRTACEGHSDQAALVRCELASLAASKGNIFDALEQLKIAEDILRNDPASSIPNALHVLSTLAPLLHKLTRFDDCFEYCQRAAVFLEETGQKMIAADSKEDFNQFVRTAENILDATVTVANTYVGKRDDVQLFVLEQILKWKCITLDVATDPILTSEAKPQELTTALTRFYETWISGDLRETSLESERLSRTVRELVGTHLNTINQTSLCRAVLNLRDSIRPFAAAEIVRYFNYVHGKHKYYALVVYPVGNSDIHLHSVDLGLAADIDRRVDRYRSTLSSMLGRSLRRKAESERDLENGVELRKACFDPLCEHMKGTRRVVVALDGALNLIPLECLPLSQDEYVIDHYELSYATSLRDLAGFSERRGSGKQDQVFGNSSFDGSILHGEEVSDDAKVAAAIIADHQEPFPPLPGAEREARHVAEKLGAGLHINEQATVAAVRSVTSPRILHLATHGFFVSKEGQGSHGVSGIALAGAANPGQSEITAIGLLTAQEVEKLDLRCTQLVVISACESAVGSATAWQGLYGLRRAFFAAGAESLVATLWEVKDEVTAELMSEFYDHLVQGKECSEALQLAKLTVKNCWPSPVVWGAFVLIGNPRCLRSHQD